jgi:hypothetical protein
MAQESASSETSSADTERRDRIQAIRNGLDRTSEFLTDEVLLAIHSAADDPETWQRALRNPRQFLTSNGIEVPDGIIIAFLELPAEGIARLAPMIPPECPTGLTASLVREVRRVCTKFLELQFCYYVRTGDGPNVSWERNCESRGVICVHWEEQVETRWVCGLRAVQT